MAGRRGGGGAGRGKISYILNHLILLKKIQTQIFSQSKSIAGLSHVLAGMLAESFLISEVPFVSQMAFQCRENISKAKRGLKC